MYPVEVCTLQMLQDLLYRGGLSEERYREEFRDFPRLRDTSSNEDDWVGPPYTVAVYDKKGFLTFRDPTPEELSRYENKQRSKLI